MRRVLSLVVAVAAGAQGQGRDSSLRWSLSTGPTLALYSDGVTTCVSSCGFYQADSRIISGAEHGKYNVALGASRRWNGTALLLRAEVLYNRSESPIRHRWPVFYFGPDTVAPLNYEQPAPVDEMFAATLGFEWDALPSRPVSPYVLTALGWGLNRIRWNTDTASTRIDAQRDEMGPLATFGAGIRARFGQHEMFLEWRRYHSVFVQMPGATIVPFSLGFRF